LGPVVVLLLLAAASAADAAELRVVRSRHYTLHSDLEIPLLVDVGRRMDAMYEEYSRRLSDFELRDDKRPLDAFLFTYKEDYAVFTGGRHQNTGGVFLPGKNQLAAFLGGQRDTLRRTLQHEAFHQFAYKALGQNMPIWLNEGMAQLFEEAIYTGEAFMMGQVPPRRVRQLQNDVEKNRLSPMRTLMGLSPEQWATNLARDQSAGTTQYNQAWAIVHYMAYGDQGRNGVKLVALLRDLGNRKNPKIAFADAYGSDLETFSAAFMNHAMTIQATAEATLLDHHDVLADLLAQLGDKGKRFNNVADFRKHVDAAKYRLQYTRGDVTWVANVAEYFRDGTGQPFPREYLYLEVREGAPLPDLVFRHPEYRIGARARFYTYEGKIEHEVIAEPGNGRLTAAGQ
jgi:hypothetical protein